MSTPAPANLEPLRRFIRSVTDVVDRSPPEEVLLQSVERSMADLLTVRDWLPDEFARCTAESYGQYLLYCDPRERFCVVSFAWGPQQASPVHNHTVWGVIGQLVGTETSQTYAADATGALREVGPLEVLHPGQVATISPEENDIHRVSNPSKTVLSISIHVYGCNIGTTTRQKFDVTTGQETPFVSSYTNRRAPEIHL
jgi:predicted metal-dependent enzyme (double-stranded beta helix superfamily)